MRSDTITGTVQDIRGQQVLVVSPSEPRTHLRHLWVQRPGAPSKVAGVKVGDRVTLAYFTTNSFGLWFITEIQS